MGRNKILIERIDETKKRKVTFTKRSKGVTKKCMELAELASCKVSLIITNEKGDVSTIFSNHGSSINEIIHMLATAAEEEKRASDPMNFLQLSDYNRLFGDKNTSGSFGKSSYGAPFDEYKDQSTNKKRREDRKVKVVGPTTRSRINSDINCTNMQISSKGISEQAEDFDYHRHMEMDCTDLGIPIDVDDVSSLDHMKDWGLISPLLVGFQGSYKPLVAAPFGGRPSSIMTALPLPNNLTSTTTTGSNTYSNKSGEAKNEHLLHFASKLTPDSEIPSELLSNGGDPSRSPQINYRYTNLDMDKLDSMSIPSTFSSTSNISEEFNLMQSIDQAGRQLSFCSTLSSGRSNNSTQSGTSNNSISNHLNIMKGYFPDPKLKLDLLGDEISVPTLMFAAAPPMPAVSMNICSLSSSSVSNSSNTVISSSGSSSSGNSSGSTSHRMNRNIIATGNVADSIGAINIANRKHGRSRDNEEEEMKNNGMTSYGGYSRKKQCTKPNHIKKYQ